MSRISESAPKITFEKLAEAQCKVDADHGRSYLYAYGRSKVRADTHDGAWDKLSKKYPQLQKALSFIAGDFYKWDPAAANLARYGKTAYEKSRHLVCVSDDVFGADKTCFANKHTDGQLKVVEEVLKEGQGEDGKGKARVLDVMAAYFSIPVDKFEKLEDIVVGGDKALLAELDEFAKGTDKEEVHTQAKDLLNRVNVNAAAQLAAAAFNKAAVLMKEDKANCGSQEVKDLQAMGTKWLKITRRLTHGRGAVTYQERKGAANDPLFQARPLGSELYCGEKPSRAIASAIEYFHTQGRMHGKLAGTSLAFLAGAVGAFDEAVIKCRKPGPTRKQKKCTGGKVPDGNLGCECPPSKPKWDGKRCYKPRRRYRPPAMRRRPPPMRPDPVVMRPTPMKRYTNMAAEE